MKVFVDSNVMMYAAGSEHPLKARAAEFLRAVQQGKIRAVTSTEVLQEILHKYHRLGRTDIGERVYALSIQLCEEVLPVTLADTDACLNFLNISGISARDALHAAVMLNHNLTSIATFDAGFDAIPGITRLSLLQGAGG